MFKLLGLNQCFEQRYLESTFKLSYQRLTRRYQILRETGRFQRFRICYYMINDPVVCERIMIDTSYTVIFIRVLSGEVYALAPFPISFRLRLRSLQLLESGFNMVAMLFKLPSLR